MNKIYILERFLEYLNSTERAASTISSYASDLYLFAKWFDETNHEIVSAIKITPTDLRKYKKYLIELPMKPNTINRKLGVIKSFVKWLWETDKLKQRFPLPKLVKQVIVAPKWLDKNQQHQMLRHLEKYSQERDVAIIKLLLNTGIRVHELHKLQWRDVKVSDRAGSIAIKYSKADKYRDVPLNKDSRSALTLLGFKNNPKKEAFVIQGQRGALSIRGIQKVLQRQLEYTPFDKVSPHVLRHTFCKNLVDAGVSLEKVAMLAGHDSLDTTRLYCQPSFNDLVESVNRIGEED